MFKIKTDAREIKKAFKELRARNIPFGVSAALNETAYGVYDDVVRSMRGAFDRPTPFTLRAFYVWTATPRTLSACIGIRDFSSGGTPAWKYLEPEADGGARKMKRMELRLSSISGGQFVLPGPGARLDGYGNISRGQLGQILSRIGAMADTGQNVSAKTVARLRKKGLVARGARADYFVGRGKNGNQAPRGVYQLIGAGQVTQVLKFTPNPPNYRVRFDFDAITIGSVDKRLGPAIENALRAQLAGQAAYDSRHSR